MMKKEINSVSKRKNSQDAFILVLVILSLLGLSFFGNALSGEAI